MCPLAMTPHPTSPCSGRPAMLAQAHVEPRILGTRSRKAVERRGCPPCVLLTDHDLDRTCTKLVGHLGLQVSGRQKVGGTRAVRTGRQWREQTLHLRLLSFVLSLVLRAGAVSMSLSSVH